MIYLVKFCCATKMTEVTTLKYRDISNSHLTHEKKYVDKLIQVARK